MIPCRSLITGLKGQCAQSDKRRNVGLFKWGHNNRSSRGALRVRSGNALVFPSASSANSPHHAPGFSGPAAPFKRVVAPRDSAAFRPEHAFRNSAFRFRFSRPGMQPGFDPATHANGVSRCMAKLSAYGHGQITPSSRSRVKRLWHGISQKVFANHH